MSMSLSEFRRDCLPALQEVVASYDFGSADPAHDEVALSSVEALTSLLDREKCSLLLDECVLIVDVLFNSVQVHHAKKVGWRHASLSLVHIVSNLGYIPWTRFSPHRSACSVMENAIDCLAVLNAPNNIDDKFLAFDLVCKVLVHCEILDESQSLTIDFIEVLGRLVTELEAFIDLKPAPSQLPKALINFLEAETEIWKLFRLRCSRSARQSYCILLSALNFPLCKANPELLHAALSSVATLAVLPSHPDMPSPRVFAALNLFLQDSDFSFAGASIVTPLVAAALHPSLCAKAQQALRRISRQFLNQQHQQQQGDGVLSFDLILQPALEGAVKPSAQLLNHFLSGVKSFLSDFSDIRREGNAGDVDTAMVSAARLAFAAALKIISARAPKDHQELRDGKAIFMLREVIAELSWVPHSTGALSRDSQEHLKHLFKLNPSWLGSRLKLFLQEHGVASDWATAGSSSSASGTARVGGQRDVLQLLQKRPPAPAPAPAPNPPPPQQRQQQQQQQKRKIPTALDSTFEFLMQQEEEEERQQSRGVRTILTSGAGGNHYSREQVADKRLKLADAADFNGRREDSRSTDFGRREYVDLTASSSTSAAAAAPPPQPLVAFKSSDIVRDYISERRSTASSRTAPQPFSVSSLALRPQPPQGQQQDHQQQPVLLAPRPMPQGDLVGTDLRSVCIDEVLRRMLKWSLSSILDARSSKPSAAAASVQLAPLRFLTEELYLNAFVKLVELEVKESVLRDLTSPDNKSNARNQHNHYNNHQQHGQGQGQGQGLAERISCQSVMRHPGYEEKLQDITFTGNLRLHDLVLVLQTKSLPTAEGALQDLPSAVTHRHWLGIVTRAQGRGQQRTQPGILLTRRGKNDDGETVGPEEAFVFHSQRSSGLSTNSTLICIPVTNLTTHLRELHALYSVEQCALAMPLSPYLLKAAPVVSHQLLNSHSLELEQCWNRLVGAGTSTSALSERGRERDWERIRVLRDALEQLQISGSVLRSTGAGKVVKMLGSNIEGQAFIPDALAQRFKELERAWRDQVKREGKEALKSTTVGGQQVVYEDPFRDKPTFIANAVWDDLCRTHNPSQLQAVRYVCAPLTSTSDTRVALIQGPPGCGKSHCVVGMVLGLLSRTSGAAAQKKKILLCTPSNAACDELLRRLVSEGVADMQVPGLRRRVALVRLGENLEQAPREVQDLMLENQVEALLQRTQLYTQWSNVRDQFRDSLALVGRLNREAQQLGGQKAEPAEHYKERREAKGQHEYNLRQLTSLEVLIDQKRNKLRRAVLDGAEVVASTLSSAGKQNFLEWLLLNHVTFDTVIVDEAAQASEPSSLIPLRYGCRNLVLVGDPRQLPATILSQQAKDGGLSRSLFERLEEAGHEVFMLSVQYRMHPLIRAFPSQHFYQGRLQDSPEISRGAVNFFNASNPSAPYFPPPGAPWLQPLSFLDFSSSRERTANDGRSISNPDEAHLIVRLVISISAAGLTYGSGGRPVSLSVITPYAAQANLISRLLRESRDCPQGLVEVNTIDGFQGREKDCVIFSCVRSNSRMGFVADKRRLNVAITRARGLLCVVGHGPTLRIDPTWQAFLDSLYARGLIYPV